MSSIPKTLGGDRLGSGNKQKVHLHNFERSTHDLSKVFRSTMSCGTLVPFMNQIGLPGDTFDISLKTRVRTEPTKAPLFGTFKMQMDVFVVPMRLYNVGLHMNMLGVGNRIKDVLLPQMNIIAGSGETHRQSSLLSYLGVRGAPKIVGQFGYYQKNALQMLAYWDIYKQYYSNKQEEIGFQIIEKRLGKQQTDTIDVSYMGGVPTTQTITITNTTPPWGTTSHQFATADAQTITLRSTIPYEDVNEIFLKIEMEEGINTIVSIRQIGLVTVSPDKLIVVIAVANWKYNDKVLKGISYFVEDRIETNNLQLKEFPLKNIDDERMNIMKADFQYPYILTPSGNYPYKGTLNGGLYPKAPQMGLGIKTYQSDLFNNWLSTEWIDGLNGINEISKVDTSSGGFSIDSLNFAKKVYDMLNRVAVSGGTYEDWQEAVYGESSMRRAESPIYAGGMSQEIAFEEVVQSYGGDPKDLTNPLGRLGGKGIEAGGQKGGNIYIKITEPSIIMGIASITPRIDYSQGNKWFTNLKTLDDLHKPNLDGIGFQELITEQMAHWDAEFNNDYDVWIYRSAGKQPAWVNYMTDYNECYGHFAEKDEKMVMTLNRQYEREYQENGGEIGDLTTYCDPQKYNYAFAVQDLTAENFWIQIASDITARRKMSAKIMPNL